MAKNHESTAQNPVGEGDSPPSLGIEKTSIHDKNGEAHQSQRNSILSDSDDESDSDPPDTDDSPGRVVNGVCKRCTGTGVEQFVSCMLCTATFHLYECDKENPDNDILSKSDGKTAYRIINKSGKCEKRPGNFRFVCDPCLTKHETKQTCTTNQNVQMLDNKVSGLSKDVSTIKKLLKQLASPGNSSGDTSTLLPQASQAVSGNPWENQTRVQNMSKSLLVIKDSCVDSSVVEKTVSSEGLQVDGKFVNKSGHTVFVLPSQKARTDLKDKLGNLGVSSNDISEPKQRYPTISIVGISDSFKLPDRSTDADGSKYKAMLKTLGETLLRQNPGIDNVMNSGKNDVFYVLVVKPLRNNNKVNQAIVKVSDAVRLAIRNVNDRVFCGLYSCRVYDQNYVKRCNKCQGFGHFARDCRNAICCGVCAAADHETQDCPKSVSTYVYSTGDKHICCVNCKKAGFVDKMHTHCAYESACPVYKSKQDKLKASLPFTPKN